MRTLVGFWLAGISSLVAACSGSPAPTPTTTTPTTAGGSGGAALAGASSGGSSGGSISAGGLVTGGAVAGLGGSAGDSVAGGFAAGSAAGGMSGTSGGGSGGVSGAAGSGGSGGDTGQLPKPSLGCGKMNPVNGARTIMTGGQTGTFNVNLPAGYDANKPMPLGFGFHGHGNPACGPTGGECQGFAMLPAVTVYMKSFSDGWEGSDVLEQNITFWQDVLALMKNEYCIDENKVFIAGVSSGGQFIEYLSCRFGDTLWQTTAVSASVVNAANMNCKGTPPVLIIHGVTDNAGNYGQGVAEMFAKRNGCSATAPAGLAQAKTDMMTAFNAQQAQHVCLDWDACTLNPVRFCISSQITYSGLTHGWPKVGGTLISEFQSTLE